MAEVLDHGAKVAKVHGVKRSPHWGSLENWFKKRFGEVCPISGLSPVQIHHAFPFHDCYLAGRPDLELALENLYALYSGGSGGADEGHHLIVGHLGNFKSYNPDLRACLKKWKGLTVAQIKALPKWKALVAKKPLSFPQMSPKQQIAFRAVLDRKFDPKKIAVFDGRKFIRNGVIVKP
jgi:hypothetical protein